MLKVRFLNWTLGITVPRNARDEPELFARDQPSAAAAGPGTRHSTFFPAASSGTSAPAGNPDSASRARRPARPLRWVGDCMVVVALGDRIRLSPSRLDSRLGRVRS